MRRLCIFALALCLCLLPACLGETAEAGAWAPSAASQRQMAIEVAYRCGMFDGHFGCQQVPGNTDHGKNANPVVTNPTADAPAPDAAALPGTPAPAGTAGTWSPSVAPQPVKPGERACPPSSELLGGNCVHYTATCRNGLAAEAAPQICMGAEEKLACKMRQDGLKDCCCLTYDRL